MTRSRRFIGPVLAALLVSLSVGYSQDDPPKTKGDGPKKSFTPPKPGDLKKYDDVITVMTRPDRSRRCIPDLSATPASGSGSTTAPPLSDLSEVKAFPLSIEVRSTLTFRSGGGGGPARGPALPSFGPGGSITALVH